MKYSKEQAVTEIKKRSRGIKRDRERKLTKGLMALACFVAIALAGEVGLMTGPTTEGDMASVYGSFLLSPESGIYVLVAVVAFLVGMAITLLIKKLHKKED